MWPMSFSLSVHGSFQLNTPPTPRTTSFKLKSKDPEELPLENVKCCWLLQSRQSKSMSRPPPASKVTTPTYGATNVAVWPPSMTTGELNVTSAVKAPKYPCGLSKPALLVSVKLPRTRSALPPEEVIGPI